MIITVIATGFGEDPTRGLSPALKLDLDFNGPTFDDLKMNTPLGSGANKPSAFTTNAADPYVYEEPEESRSSGYTSDPFEEDNYFDAIDSLFSNRK